MKKYEITASVAALVLIGVVGYGAYSYQNLQKEKLALLSQLHEARIRSSEVWRQLQERQTIIDSFQGQIQNIGQTVGTLEKLAATDEELLKKYSKVYFLNENYTPATLTDIEEKYIYNGSTNYLIHAKVWPYLRNLLVEAEKGGMGLLVASAFRSYGTQASLKSGYKVIYGSGANQFSADQGYSEHQLGTTVDFTTQEVGGEFSRFNKDPAFKWLKDNAYKYGFILSYPEGNAYYQYEPWHWRFVGVRLATRLHEDGRYFYDLNQREIDKYLVNLFD